MTIQPQISPQPSLDWGQKRLSFSNPSFSSSARSKTLNLEEAYCHLHKAFKLCEEDKNLTLKLFIRILKYEFTLFGDQILPFAKIDLIFNRICRIFQANQFFGDADGERELARLYLPTFKQYGYDKFVFFVAKLIADIDVNLTGSTEYFKNCALHWPTLLSKMIDKGIDEIEIDIFVETVQITLVKSPVFGFMRYFCINNPASIEGFNFWVKFFIALTPDLQVYVKKNYQKDLEQYFLQISFLDTIFQPKDFFIAEELKDILNWMERYFLSQTSKDSLVKQSGYYILSVLSPKKFSGSDEAVFVKKMIDIFSVHSSGLFILLLLLERLESPLRALYWIEKLPDPFEKIKQISPLFAASLPNDRMVGNINYIADLFAKAQIIKVSGGELKKEMFFKVAEKHRNYKKKFVFYLKGLEGAGKNDFSESFKLFLFNLNNMESPISISERIHFFEMVHETCELDAQIKDLWYEQLLNCVANFSKIALDELELIFELLKIRPSIPFEWSINILKIARSPFFNPSLKDLQSPSDGIQLANRVEEKILNVLMKVVKIPEDISFRYKINWVKAIQQELKEISRLYKVSIIKYHDVAFGVLGVNGKKREVSQREITLRLPTILPLLQKKEILLKLLYAIYERSNFNTSRRFSKKALKAVKKASEINITEDHPQEFCIFIKEDKVQIDLRSEI